MLLSTTALLTTLRPTGTSLRPGADPSRPSRIAAALDVDAAPHPAGDDPEKDRRHVEAFMREQVRQHAWVNDTEVVTLRTWWPEAELCAVMAELVDPSEARPVSWLLAQVEVDDLRRARHPADRLATFQALRLSPAHVPVLLECAVQVETNGVRAGPRGARSDPCP
jgi:hypothetical protein